MVLRRIVGLLLGLNPDAINVTQAFILTPATCQTRVRLNEFQYGFDFSCADTYCSVIRDRSSVLGS